MMLLVSGLTGLASCSDDYAQPPVVIPEGGIGTGAWDNPMTAYQLLLGSVNPEHNPGWVTGYVVGVVNTDIATVINEKSAQFEGPFSTATNLIIAMSPDEKNWENCATVQLSSGTNVRTALNLVDNEDVLGKQVTIKGETGTKYCGAYGMRTPSDFAFGDKGNEEVELKPIDGPFYQDFEASNSMDVYEKQGWKNTMVSGGLSGWYLREFDNNRYITVSAYQGTQTGGPYENWLITPAIDMSKITTKTLEFITQAAYPADDCSLEVYVLDGNNPTTATKTKLDAQMATPPASGGPFSSWVNSGKLDLTQFTGTIYIGWRYWSAKGGSGFSSTYCVDDINVGNAEKPEPPTPDTPSTDGGYEGLSSNADGWTFDNVLMPSPLTYVWKWDGKYLKASAFVSGAALETVSIAVSPVISLKGKTSATVEFEHAAKFQTTCKELCKFVVREKDSAAWVEYDIPEWQDAVGEKWIFVNSGKIDISKFAGKEIQVGFKYASSKAGADTWEVKNLKVTGK